MASLLRWLGPWSGDKAPKVSRRREQAGPTSVYVYGSARSAKRGVYLVVPGMHFLGPDDPRLDRFCSVLARSGFLVVAPRLEEFLALRVSQRVTDQLAPAFDFAESLGAKPTLFSISFGSMPAIELAARPAYRERVRRLVLFGGFCDFETTIRHAVTGAGRDPLNAPVVFSNLLPHVDLDIDRSAVLAAWREMVERTWGRMELKKDGARDPYAHAIAERLGDREREVFLAGCGLSPYGVEIFERGLAAARGRFDFTDPRPHLAKMLAPVTIVHGRDDDVIPFTEAERLFAALPEKHPCEMRLTGFYGHTGSSLPNPRAAAQEARTLLALVARLSDP